MKITVYEKKTEAMRTCPYCRQEFDTSGEYAQFLVLKVGGSENIICGDCKKSFLQWKLYNTHYGSAMGYTPVAFIICNKHAALGQDDYSTGLAI